MNQLKSAIHPSVKKNTLKNVKEDQFEYLGRWVDKSTFRAFVYNKTGNQMLAKSFDEYENLTSSGLWFASKIIPPNDRKQKDAAISNS